MPSTRRLLADCEIAARTHAELSAIISLLCENGCLPTDVRSWGIPPDLGPGVLAPWKASLAALRTDANAELPE